MLGRVAPRIHTKPRRDLSAEESSWGYDFIRFCALIGYELDQWQQWLAIHLGELNQDGSRRFRKAIVIVARQNGKSLFACLMVLYWMFVERVPLVYGVHKDRAEAKKAWTEALEIARGNEVLRGFLAPTHTTLQTGDEDFFTTLGTHYRFGAPNRRAARGRTVHMALIDELREHKNADCWNALVPATNAVGEPLILCITNEGDMSATVLHEEYDAALLTVETGDGDDTAFLAAWSSPPDSDPLDLEALAHANPSLGRIRANGTGLRAAALLSQAHTAVRAGGARLADFKTEMMCIRVDQLDAAIRPEDWTRCGTIPEDAVDLAAHRGALAACFDVSADTQHATLSVAALIDGVTHVQTVSAWDGTDARKRLREDLPGWLQRIKPRKVVWFPGGPSAAVADEWTGRRVSGVRIEPIRAEDVVRACMGMEEQVASGAVRHPNDPLLNKQVAGSQRLPQGDGWRFARRGADPIDATYSAAGAIHAARNMPVLAPLAIG